MNNPPLTVAAATWSRSSLPNRAEASSARLRSCACCSPCSGAIQGGVKMDWPRGEIGVTYTDTHLPGTSCAPPRGRSNPPAWPSGRPTAASTLRRVRSPPSCPPSATSLEGGSESAEHNYCWRLVTFTVAASRGREKYLRRVERSAFLQHSRPTLPPSRVAPPHSVPRCESPRSLKLEAQFTITMTWLGRARPAFAAAGSC